mgnify:CR=1 FL=1
MKTKGYNRDNFDRSGTSFLGILEDYRAEMEKDDESLALPIRLRPTWELYQQGYDLEEISRQTARQPSTVSGHLEDLIEKGMVADVDRFITGGIIKNVQILAHGAWCVLWIDGPSFDQTGICHKALAADEAVCNATRHSRLKQMPQ